MVGSEPPVPTPVPTDAGGGAGPSGPGLPRPRLPKRGKDDEGGSDPAEGDLGPRRYGFDKAEVRAIIERYFKVYEERDALPGLDQAVLVAFFVNAPREEIDARYPELQAELGALDEQLQPVLREEGGETMIVVSRRQERPLKRASKLPPVLLLLTVVTLTFSGSAAWVSYEGSIDLLRMVQPRSLLLGFLGFALPILFVFLVQEAARHTAAKRHNVRLGRSFIVPVPPFVFFPSIGTFGSLVNSRQAQPDRKALFDISAAGPLAGFLAALPVVVLGFVLTGAAGVVVPDGGDAELVVLAPDGTAWDEAVLRGDVFDPFSRAVPDERNRAHNVSVTWSALVAGREYGNSGWLATARGTGATGKPMELTFRTSAFADNGSVIMTTENVTEVAPGVSVQHMFDVPNGTDRLEVSIEYKVPARTTVPLGEPLAFRALSTLFAAEEDFVIHPVALAGWTALLVVGITLVPAGRLDGGGIARAVLGERMVIVAYLSIGALAVLSFMYPHWVYLVLFVLLFLGARHPAPLNERTPLDPRRRVIAVLLLLVFVLCFVPIPAPFADFA